MELSCLLSTLLFVTSNLLGFSYFHRFWQRSHHDAESREAYYHNFTALDPDHIQTQWEHRTDQYALELAAGILNAMAWIVFCIPLLQVAWIQYQHSNNRRLALHVTVAVLAVAGSTTEFIARLLFIGATSTGNWLANDFNLDTWISDDEPDEIGWRTLEMIHLVTRGFLLWIDAAEWLFLSAIFLFLYLSVVRTEQSHFSRNWARLGLVIGLLCFMDFSSEVLRLKSWMTFSFVAIIISWVSRMLLMPWWLLWLGRQLSKVSKMDHTKSGGAQEMTRYGGSSGDGGSSTAAGETSAIIS